MVEAQIVRAWQERGEAHLAVRVQETENGEPVDVEYVGSVPCSEVHGKPVSEQQTALVEAVRTVRETQHGCGTELDIAGSVAL